MRRPALGPRVALVAGAGSGIGAATVERCVQLGIPVLATDRRLASVSRWPAHDVLDVTDPVDWAHAIARAAALTGALGARLLVINSAGLSHAGPLTTESPAVTRAMVEVNLFGAINAVRQSAAAVAGRVVGRAHVVNVASFAGVTAVPGLATYTAAKHAVRGYSLAARQELAGRGVAVTVVAVDAVATPMLWTQVTQPEAAIAFSAKRLLDPQEVAATLCGSVLRDEPAEVLLPRGRGAVMKAGSLWPTLGAMGARRFRRIGLRHQARLRRDWAQPDPCPTVAAPGIGHADLSPRTGAGAGGSIPTERTP